MTWEEEKMNWKNTLRKAPFSPFKRKKPLDVAAQQNENRAKIYHDGQVAFNNLMADKKLFKMLEDELKKQMARTPNNPNYVIDTTTIPNFNTKYAPIFENVFGNVEDKEMNKKNFLENLEARFGVWEATMDYNRYIKLKINQ